MIKILKIDRITWAVTLYLKYHSVNCLVTGFCWVSRHYLEVNIQYLTTNLCKSMLNLASTKCSAFLMEMRLLCQQNIVPHNLHIHPPLDHDTQESKRHFICTCMCTRGTEAVLVATEYCIYKKCIPTCMCILLYQLTEPTPDMI